MLYTIFLITHSIVRWLVVIAALAAVVKAFYGWITKMSWTKIDDQLGIWFTSILDLQLLVGLVLYVFLSPITQTAFSNFGAAMKDTVLRFFAVEHISIMILAVVLAHVGRALSRKAVEPLQKYRWAAIGFGLAVLAILFAIPWPFAQVARPWIRF
jgi:hypothetical protein